MKYVVEQERKKGQWEFLAVVPANSVEAAVAMAKRYFVGPPRNMKAHKQVITKK